MKTMLMGIYRYFEIEWKCVVFFSVANIIQQCNWCKMFINWALPIEKLTILYSSRLTDIDQKSVFGFEDGCCVASNNIIRSH